MKIPSSRGYYDGSNILYLKVKGIFKRANKPGNPKMTTHLILEDVVEECEVGQHHGDEEGGDGQRGSVPDAPAANPCGRKQNKIE
jgi:hypothetical protein